MPTAAERYPRLIAPRLREALTDTPAVLIHGPRQAGKTTLARLKALGHPPDKQEKATRTVLEQPALLSEIWAVA